MSGGSHDYAYARVQEMADDMLMLSRGSSGLRNAFARHLRKVAKAMHDIEWVDSGDYRPGDEDAAIRECLGDGPSRFVERFPVNGR